MRGRAVSLAAIVCWLGASALGAGEFVELISSFEDDSDRQAYFLREGRGKAYSTERASDGRRSLKITFAGGRALNLGSLYGTSMPFDWSGFDAFKMDVYAARDCSLRIKMKSGAWANDPSSKRFTKTARLAAGKWTTVVITLREMGANLHRDGVVYINLGPSAGGDLFFDNLRLTAAKRPAPVVRYLRQTWTGDASTAMTVAWQSRETSGELRWGPRGSSPSKTVKAATTRAFPTGVGAVHEATVTGLNPDTEYVYQVRSGAGRWTAQKPFRTAPASDDAKFTFIACADTKGGRDVLAGIFRQFAPPGAPAASQPRFMLYAGDAPQFGGIRAHWERWFQAIEPFASLRPLMPSSGNHELAGDPKLANYAAYNALSKSSGSELYYSFDCGPVHVIALETEIGDFARQVRWLQKDLAACRKSWKVAFFHSPLFSSGSVHGSDRAARGALAPLFDRHHVDLVFSGDDHIYERSKPVNVTRSPNAPVGSYKEGTCYVISACAGADKYNARTGNWWTAALKTKTNHACRVTVNGRRSLELEAVDLRGNVFDRVKLEK